MPVTAATINIGGPGNGGLVNVGGSNTDPNANVLTNNTTEPNGTASTNALSNNAGSGPTTANANVGGAGQTNRSVLLDLFGNDDGSDAVATLGTNGAGGTGPNGARVDLFGGNTGNGATGSSNPNGAQQDLFGPAGGNGSSNSAASATRRISEANGKCFTPTAAQLAKLTSRHDYSAHSAASWSSASEIKVISVGLCDRAKVTGAAAISKLQALAQQNPTIVENLQKQGRSAKDIIAVDQSGDTLVVYVI